MKIVITLTNGKEYVVHTDTIIDDKKFNSVDEIVNYITSHSFSSFIKINYKTNFKTSYISVMQICHIEIKKI
ncbi:hypothetical protein [Thomasclavelia sp.]